MNRFFIYLSNLHEEIFKALMLIGAVAFIVFILPRNPRFSYEYQKGKPWLYEDLSAPFAFPLAKTEDQLKKEKQEILKNTTLYFRVDTTVPEKKIAEAAHAFSIRCDLLKSRDASRMPEKEKKFQWKLIHNLLDEAYRRGIIMLPEVLESHTPDYEIVVLRNNVAQSRSLGEMFSLKNAREYITNRLDKDPRASRELLEPLIEPFLSYNVFYDESFTRKIQQQLLDNISSTYGLVQADERIIRKGELVDQEKFNILESLKKEYEDKVGTAGGNRIVVFGQLLLVVLSLSMLVIFLYLFRKDIFADNQRIALLLLLIAGTTALYCWSLHLKLFNLYLVPFCIVPIVVRVFFDTRLALFVHLVLLLIVGFVAPNGLEFMFIQIVAGMVAIFSIVNMRNRSQLFISICYIFLSYALSYAGISVVHEGGLTGLRWDELGWFAGNVMLTLFAYPLIYVIEKIFGFTSDVSLMELTDTNNRLLRELAFKAPGTFQHSLQVANLAESAMYKIGGNTLLTRVGALYHDIGKMDMPMYFIENQNTGINPHDELAFEESAKIITAHVSNGIEKARKHRLPEEVMDFIRTHHGTTRVQYFYLSFLKNYPDRIVDENMFRYPGPVPFSRETAVVMMADAVEAASRSIQHTNYESIDKLVDSIIEKQIEQQQFINCDITYRDVTEIKKIFKKMLTSIYHVRIEYPH